MVNNHGDRCCALTEVIPLPNWPFLWLINGGDPIHLLTGVILQVVWRYGFYCDMQ